MGRLAAALLSAGLILAWTLPAEAGGWRHHHGPHRHYDHGYRGHYAYRHHRHFKPRSYVYRHHRHQDYGDEILLGAGIIGGAVIVGSVVAQPHYAPPPPPVVYYTPPPQPYCVQDQVYRTLPDGSVQWGTRTRCY